MKSEFQFSVITKLRRLREENNYSQSQIASILGISNGQMGNIESLKFPQKYTLGQIYKLCRLFNVPIEQIFVHDGERAEGVSIVELLILNIIKYEER